MKKTFLLLSVLSVAACGSERDASQANFTKAMNAYLAKRGDLCVAKSAWPIDVTQSDMDHGARNAIQMPAMEKVGLVSSSVAAVEVASEKGPIPMKVRRYELTETGKKYYLARPPRAQTSDFIAKDTAHDFCAAKLSLDKVVGWEAPKKAGDNTETVVSFTYQVKADPWTNDPEIRKAFPMVDRLIQGAGSVQLKEAFLLTPDGWVAKDL